MRVSVDGLMALQSNYRLYSSWRGQLEFRRRATARFEKMRRNRVWFIYTKRWYGLYAHSVQTLYRALNSRWWVRWHNSLFLSLFQMLCIWWCINHFVLNLVNLIVWLLRSLSVFLWLTEHTSSTVACSTNSSSSDPRVGRSVGRARSLPKRCW